MSLSEVEKKLIDFIQLRLQRPVTASKVLVIVNDAISFVDDLRELDGPQKKQLVLKAVRYVISNSDIISDDDRQTLLDLLDLMGSSVVDTIVDFVHNGFERLRTRFPRCFCSSRNPKSIHRARSNMLGDTNKEYEDLKSYLFLKLHRPFTAPKIMLLLAAGIKFIDHYKHLSGTEKKNLVIQALREVVQGSSHIDESDKAELIELIDNLADDLIEILVAGGRAAKSYCKCK